VQTTDMSRVGPAPTRLDDYFALKTGRDLVNECLDRVEKYHRSLEESGRLAMWKQAYRNYYLGGIQGARLRTGGDKNEFVLAQVNHYANIMAHILNAVTNQRPNLRARASNSDFKSLAQTKIANHVLEYYMDKKGLEGFLVAAAELSDIFSEGFVEALWDPTLGKEVRPDENGNVIREGDIAFSAYSPLDVIRDATLGSNEQVNWRITRKWASRWELAAKFPQYMDEIIGSTTSVSNMRNVRIGHAMSEQDQDQIPLYTLIHDKGNVIPEGRFVQFIDNENVILIDSPLPHKTILHRIVPKEQHGTIFGYTVGFDLLPIQENLNTLYSIIASNQAMFGVQSLLIAKGSAIEYSALMGGLKIIQWQPMPGVDTRPSALQLTSTPPEVFKHIDHLIQQMETISGVNSMIRGNPESNVESGAYAALLTSQAIQFLSSFQESYTALKESVGTGVIEILKDYATTPRLMSLAGKHNSQYMKEFKGDDISSIERVTVEDTNPMARTTAGKMTIAQDLIKNQMVTDPKQYLSVLETGTLEPLTQGMESQLMLIDDENERLAQGGQLPVVFTDLHVLHIQEHATVLANLDARMNPDVVAAVQAHIQQHINLAKTLDPVVAGATNQPILGGTGGTPPPSGPTSNAPPPGNNAPSSGPHPPSMPKNPLSNQPFNAATGGL
jgi:hypothetical protein